MSEIATGKVFGIDLGTTYSCIAHIDDEYGKPVVLPDPRVANIFTVPSVVLFENDGSVIVGTHAKQAFDVADMIVAFAKRDIGKAESDGKLVTYNIAGKEYTPHYISGQVLKQLKSNAEKVLNLPDGGVKDVVITVPAYFGANEIKATKLAGEIAGLNVMQVISEPTAAAIFYYTDSGTVREDKKKNVIIYDLGGGTFDVTFMAVDGAHFTEICTAGDHELGGKDWDEKLREIVKAKAPEVQLDSEADTMLLFQCEEGKWKLSELRQAKIPCGNKRVVVTREEFEAGTKDLLDRTKYLFREVIEEAASKGYPEFDEIVLVGGSTRMPQIEQMLEDEFGKKPVYTDPDQAVAKGAAIYAVYTQIQELVNLPGGSPVPIPQSPIGPGIQRGSFTIQRLTSKSYGTKATEGSTGIEKVFNIVPKFSQTPCEWSDEKAFFHYNEGAAREEFVGFYTLIDDMRSIKFEIMQNNSGQEIVLLEDAEEIGDGMLIDLPPGLPKGTPVKVIFKITQDGDIELLGSCAGRSVTVKGHYRIEMSQAEMKAAQAATNIGISKANAAN
jgi:actin-like ATPase involved in cell morphogenesis